MRKFLKVISSVVLSFSILLNMSAPILANDTSSVEERMIDRGDMPEDVKTEVGKLISYYAGGYRADVLKSLQNLKGLSTEYHDIWKSIVNYWDWIEEEMVDNIGVTPGGIPNPKKHAFIVLGFALNSDGTMKEELVGRLEVAKASADKYPDSYVLVTGGVNKNGWTEGKRMHDWLVENGIAENRIIVEEKAPDTAGNATNSFQMLYKDYDVETVSLISSQYHIKRGSILYYAESLLKAHELGVKPITFIGEANAGWYRADLTSESMTQKASSLRSVARVSTVSVSSSILTGLNLNGKTEYTQGENLDVSVTSVDDENYGIDLTKYTTFSGYDSQVVGDQNVIATFTQGGKAITANFPVHVSKTPDATVDKSKLEALITACDERDQSAYTRRSFRYFTTALEEAKTVFNDVSATQELVVKQYNQLSDALKKLVKLENLALTKQVEASHNQAEAFKITDNNMATYWTSIENKVNVPIEDSSFIIDLGETYALDTIKVYPYYASNNRYYHYDVYVSNDKDQWIKVAEERSTELCTANGNTHRLDQILNARYVKVQGVAVSVANRPDINNFHVVETQVYGEKINPELDQMLANIDLAITEAAKLNQKDYNQKSWTNFNKALQSLKQMRLQNPTLEEATEAMNAYSNAFDHYILGKSGHTAVKVDEVSATCLKAGNITYWYCADCDHKYRDASLTQIINDAEITIPQLQHDVKKVDAKAATCVENGNIAYWLCEVCHTYFGDKDLTAMLTQEETVVKAAGHQIIAVEAKDATLETEGNIAYWYCKICDTYYSDAALTKTISKHDIKLAKLIENKQENNEQVKPAATGDVTNTFIIITMLFASAGMILISKKNYAKN